MSLHRLANYAPFRLDALGLVTILGGPELDQAFGTLRQNRYFETMPTIAPFVVAGDYISKPLPGFVLYNITDGIMATDISAWFGRWLLAQNLTWNSSTLFISYRAVRKQKSFISAYIKSLVITLVIMSILLAIAVVTGDRWGAANVVSMAASGIVRWFTICQLRVSMEKSRAHPGVDDDLVKVLCTLPSGRAVTIFTTRSIVINNLLTNPRPLSNSLYTASKIAGWTCYGCHVVSLGSTALVNQLIAVTILIGTSMMIARGVGVDNSNLAQTLVLKQQDIYGKVDSRSQAYSRLALSPEEEDGLVAWGLFPQRRNAAWWQRYTTTFSPRGQTRM